jgi:hypothetical protein
MTIRAEETAENLHTARLRLPDGDIWFPGLHFRGLRVIRASGGAQFLRIRFEPKHPISRLALF